MKINIIISKIFLNAWTGLHDFTCNSVLYTYNSHYKTSLVGEINWNLFAQADLLSLLKSVYQAAESIKILSWSSDWTAAQVQGLGQGFYRGGGGTSDSKEVHQGAGGEPR